MLMLAMSAFAFTACEDVPEPYTLPGTETGTETGDSTTVVAEPSGSGTQADPYNVAAAVQLISALDADVQTETIYVKGKVVSIKEFDTGVHGNATYYISDNGTKEGQLYIFRSRGLGNNKFTAESTPLAEGDDVVICGLFTNYKGNTPETVTNKSYLYSHNGKTADSGSSDTPDPTPAEGTYVSESFASDFGSFTVNTIKGTSWIIDYSTAKATGYDNASKTTTPSESYLVSAAIDLSAATEVAVSFEYILRYVTSNGTPVAGISNKVLITKNYTGNPATTEWTDITGTLTEGKDWNTFYKYSVAVPAEFLGQSNVVVALYFACDASSGTWEVKNLTIKDGKADEGSQGGEQGGEQGGSQGGDVPVVEGAVDAASWGLDNQTSLTTLTMPDGATLTFDAGGNSNGPKYYTTGLAFRMYPKNSVRIDAEKTIKSVQFVCDVYNGQTYNASGDVSATSGTVNVANEVITVIDVNSNSVTITNTSTQTGAPSQIRMKSIAVVYAE